MGRECWALMVWVFGWFASPLGAGWLSAGPSTPPVGFAVQAGSGQAALGRDCKPCIRIKSLTQEKQGGF
jgi:hypothetical protein